MLSNCSGAGGGPKFVTGLEDGEVSTVTSQLYGTD